MLAVSKYSNEKRFSTKKIALDFKQILQSTTELYTVTGKENLYVGFKGQKSVLCVCVVAFFDFGFILLFYGRREGVTNDHYFSHQDLLPEMP